MIQCKNANNRGPTHCSSLFRIVASAAVLPEAVEEEHSSPIPSKRKLSSASVEDTKRRRLSQNAIPEIIHETTPQAPRSSGKSTSRETDERKRGKRLFGALLGTLGQNSSSTAQKRRADIERKQREKLKVQAEEDDEKKRLQLDALLESRRLEQELYDQRSVSLLTESHESSNAFLQIAVKHSNMLARAQFLKTRIEPILVS